MVTRWAHNPKTDGSIPSPATKKFFTYYLKRLLELHHISYNDKHAITGCESQCIAKIVSSIQNESVNVHITLKVELDLADG